MNGVPGYLRRSRILGVASSFTDRRTGNRSAPSMKVLFVHNNFPAQFRNVAEELREAGSFELAAIGAQSAQAVEGVAVHRYHVPTIDVSATHPFARRFDAECWRAEQVLMAASALAASGFIPGLHPRP